MKDKIRLKAVGDVMLGDFPLALGFGVRSSILANRDGHLFDKIKHALKECDICFGNLEAVLSDYGLKNNDIRSVQMRGKPSFVEMLKDAGFNVLSLANNHAMQHGSEAFIETKDVVMQAGIAPVGVLGVNSRVVPHFIDVNGIRVCFLAYSLRPEKYSSRILYAQSDPTEISQDIKVNKEISDIVVLSLHWGDEFVQIPSQEQMRNAHSFVDAGASLVIGHHSHVIQGIERYKNGLIAYSLGNFVFDFWQKKMKKTLILNCELSKSGVDSFSITTAYIDEGFCPVVLSGNESNKLYLKIDSLSMKIKKIDTNCDKQKIKYIIIVKTALIINKLENRVYFIVNLFKYERWIVLQSLSSFIKSRSLK